MVWLSKTSVSHNVVHIFLFTDLLQCFYFYIQYFTVTLFVLNAEYSHKGFDEISDSISIQSLWCITYS